MIKPDTPISLPVSLIDEVLRYLALRPYGEVYMLMGALRSETEAQVKSLQPAAE